MSNYITGLLTICERLLMPLSKVIRIDAQVWAELQQRARPFEDTPNSVLRRVFGLPDEGAETDSLDPRITKLLGLVQESVGEEPQVSRVRKNYSFLSQTDEVVAYIRPQQQKLRVGTSKETAEKAGLQGWDRERKDGFFGGPSFRWYIPDGDEEAYRLVDGLLSKVWMSVS
jgi:hypothetical protein